MEHIYWVVEGLLTGRPGPLLEPWDLLGLRDGGLQVVVSLGEEEEPDRILAAGLRAHLFPLPPVLLLTEERRQDLLEGLESALPIIHGEAVAGRPVLVHCHAGKDRTGVVLAAYLMRYHGLSAGQAIRRVRAARPDAMSAPGYEEAAREFGRREAGRRAGSLAK